MCLQGVGGWGSGERWGDQNFRATNFLFINFYTKISLTKLEDNLIFYSFPFIDVLSGVLFGRAPGRVGGTKFSNN